MFDPGVQSLLLDILIVFLLFWLLLSTVFLVVVTVRMRQLYRHLQRGLDAAKNIGLAIGGSGILFTTFVKVLLKRLIK